MLPQLVPEYGIENLRLTLQSTLSMHQTEAKSRDQHHQRGHDPAHATSKTFAVHDGIDNLLLPRFPLPRKIVDSLDEYGLDRAPRSV